MNLDEEIKKAKSICITGHINPDGDCVGSNLGMYNYILNMYNDKEVDVYLQKPNIKFSFLKGFENIISMNCNNKNYDLCILLDSSSMDRTGEFEKYLRNATTLIILDHHKTNNITSKYAIIKEDASSTCEVCFDLMNKQYINKFVAECLYLGIIHDTGVFRFKTTSPHTMEIASFLMQKDIDFNYIQEETFYTKTFYQQIVTGFCLQRLKRYYDNKVVYTYLTLKEQADFHVGKKDIDNIIAYIRETKGIKCAIFAYEITRGEYKVSLRSNDDNLDVSEVCLNFKGGGHKLAAGGNIKAQSEEIIEILLQEIKKQI
ncbi:MAG: bifunctional oligoribonuclease/PAP phosphatase NrnA [Eubacteriales bacterium]|nr:bifunctional oligoribonuclease/PAP phosphatase NrnA [Eubacteriales bacterium]